MSKLHWQLNVRNKPVATMFLRPWSLILKRADASIFDKFNYSQNTFDVALVSIYVRMTNKVFVLMTTV